MPLPFEFEGKGVLNFEGIFGDFGGRFDKTPLKRKFVLSEEEEPTSILDNNIISSPSPPTSSSSALSSSFGTGGGGGGGGGGCCSTETASVAAVSGNPSQKWPPESQETSSNVGGVAAELFHPFPPPSLEISSGAGATAAGAEKCGGGMGMEEWDNDGQEQNILRWIMGDVEDPSMGLNKVLSAAAAAGGGGGGPGDFEFNSFGVVDQGFGLDSNHPVGQFQQKLGLAQTLQQNQMFSAANLPPILSPPPPQTLPFDVKPQIFNPQLVMNQHQSQNPQQNPAFFLPLPYQNEESHLLSLPQAKRHNPGTVDSNPNTPKGPFLDPGIHPNQLNLLPHYQQQRSALASKKMAVDEQLGSHHQQQQQIIDQLFKAADLVQSGSNPILAQGILARLNHQLSPIGKPFHRAAFYFKEAIQSLLHSIVNNMNPPQTTSSMSSPFSLIFKIGAYKSFSEISPFVQFANFTCNQALLEVLDGYDQIHVVDFDIGYGGQWASLMQELALRGNGAPSLKITAFASPSTHDQLELSLTRENLCHFASEINMAFEFEIVNIDVLTSSSWSMPIHVMETEAVAVNLPVGSFSNYQIPLPLVLRFVKNLSPKIIVSMDRGCDRTDLPFSNHVIHALQSYSNLLESLDAVNVNLDSLQKIERFLLQPSIEKIVMGRYRFPDKTQHWRSLFLSAGFSPLTFSNFTESQAECVVKRTPVRGFHVEKRLSSLVLCWQRRELVSVSAWRC